MTIKKSIYVSGPRMGTNNYMHGIEIVDFSRKKKKSAKRVRPSRSNKKGNK